MDIKKLKKQLEKSGYIVRIREIDGAHFLQCMTPNNKINGFGAMMEGEKIVIWDAGEQVSKSVYFGSEKEALTYISKKFPSK